MSHYSFFYTLNSRLNLQKLLYIQMIKTGSLWQNSGSDSVFNNKQQRSKQQLTGLATLMGEGGVSNSTPSCPASLLSCIAPVLLPTYPESYSPSSYLSCLPPVLLHSLPEFLSSCFHPVLNPNFLKSLFSCIPHLLNPSSPASYLSCVPSFLYLSFPKSLLSFIPSLLNPPFPESLLSSCIPPVLHSTYLESYFPASDLSCISSVLYPSCNLSLTSSPIPPLLHPSSSASIQSWPRHSPPGSIHPPPPYSAHTKSFLCDNLVQCDSISKISNDAKIVNCLPDRRTVAQLWKIFLTGSHAVCLTRRKWEPKNQISFHCPSKMCTTKKTRISADT